MLIYLALMFLFLILEMITSEPKQSYCLFSNSVNKTLSLIIVELICTFFIFTKSLILSLLVIRLVNDLAGLTINGS